MYDTDGNTIKLPSINQRLQTPGVFNRVRRVQRDEIRCDELFVLFNLRLDFVIDTPSELSRRRKELFLEKVTAQLKVRVKGEDGQY